jgi:hypothetical protein
MTNIDTVWATDTEIQTKAASSQHFVITLNIFILEQSCRVLHCFGEALLSPR